MFIKVDKRFVQVEFAKIKLLQAYGNYVKVYIDDQVFLTPRTLLSFEKLISKDIFLQVHKSAIINRTLIDSIENDTINIGSIEVPIGRSYKSDLKKILNIT